MRSGSSFSAGPAPALAIVDICKMNQIIRTLGVSVPACPSCFFRIKYILILFFRMFTDLCCYHHNLGLSLIPHSFPDTQPSPIQIISNQLPVLSLYIYLSQTCYVSRITYSMIFHDSIILAGVMFPESIHVVASVFIFNVKQYFQSYNN